MKLCTVLSLCLTLLGCGGGGDLVASSEATNFRLLLTDSPLDADHVYVTIDRVELIREVDGGEKIEVLTDESQEFDLLELQNDLFAVLGEGTFPEGDYAGVRLIVAHGNPGRGIGGNIVNDAPNRIVFGSDEYPMAVPSGSQTGIKLFNSFEIRKDVITELTIDFNVATSVVELGKNKNNFLLKPRMTLVQKIISGSISGTVTGEDLTTARVSAQQDGKEVLSAKILNDGTYRLSPLLPGTYTLVATSTGYGNEVLENNAVTAATDLTDRDFDLDASDTGSIAGTGPSGDDTAEIWLMQDGNFIALVGPDSVTGEFLFEDVAVGTYDIVLFLDDVEEDRIDDVEVTADTESDGHELGLDP